MTTKQKDGDTVFQKQLETIRATLEASEDDDELTLAYMAGAAAERQKMKDLAAAVREADEIFKMSDDPDFDTEDLKLVIYGCWDTKHAAAIAWAKEQEK
jgi:hypothetical protein